MSGGAPSASAFEARDDYGNFDANLRFLRDRVSLGPHVRALEIGAGKGRLLRELQHDGVRVLGVETNAWIIAESRRLYGHLPITRVTGHALPFADETFDLVLSFDVFEHIRDSDGHLHEVRRVLKPGGLYLLQTPNKWTNSVFETIRWRSLTAWRADHCALHSYSQARRRFTRHGFDVRFHSVPVVTEFFKRKVRRYLGPLGVVALRVVNPDRFPMPLRTNFYIEAIKREV